MNTSEAQAKKIGPANGWEMNIDLLKTVLGVITGSVSGLYAFGYMIVNVRLGSLGVHDFSLANPAYLPAGILFTIISAVGLIPLLVGIILQSNVKFSTHLQGFGAVLLVSIILSVLGFLVLYGLFFGIMPRLYNGWVKHLGMLCLLLWTAIWLAMSLIRTTGSTVMPLLMMVIAYFFLPFLLLSTFGTFLYPHISASYGGGSPDTVQFVIASDDQIELFTQIGIEVTGNTTERLQLVNDDGSTFIILLHNGRAARIDKDLVANILYWTPKQLDVLSQSTPTPSASTPVPGDTLPP